MSDEIHTLEKFKIVQKLGDVEKEIVRMNGNSTLINMTLKSIDKTIESHGREIWGNGGPGLKLKVDRIIQRERFVSWFLAILFVAFVGIASRLVYDAFRVGG